jgi:hypothetical protein
MGARRFQAERRAVQWGDATTQRRCQSCMIGHHDCITAYQRFIGGSISGFHRG